MTLVDEWAAKAEADYKGAIALHRKRREPLPDLVCYHSQQCAEKYLKAFITLKGTPAPKTHNLRELLRLGQTYETGLARLAPDVTTLNPHGVLIRYPGPSATALDAAEAIEAIRRVHRYLRKLLGL